MAHSVNLVSKRARSGKVYVEKSVRLDGMLRTRAEAELRTLKAARGNDHLNQLKKHLWDDRSGMASFILEHCDRGSLSGKIQDFLDRGKNFSKGYVWHTMKGIAKGLAFLHHGVKDAEKDHPVPGWDPIWHLDLKPCNVFLTNVGKQGGYPRVVIGDFGCAVFNKDKVRGLEHPSRQSCGTPQWYPPEGRDGTRYGAETDLYQLGLTVSTMCRMARGPDIYAIEGGTACGRRFGPDLNQARSHTESQREAQAWEAPFKCPRTSWAHGTMRLDPTRRLGLSASSSPRPLMLSHAVKRLPRPAGHQRTTRNFSHARLTTPDSNDRKYRVLAIETSCDDTSVAVVTARKHHDGEHASKPLWALQTHFHERVTANNDAHTGIHPVVALDSHRAHTAPMVKRALEAFRQAEHGQQLDFVAVTRGPGMRTNLSEGLNTAKGLAVALNIPLLAVHHMQAHALTPRLTTAQSNQSLLERLSDNDSAPQADLAPLEPDFPFLSLLVSGGHTMLLDSTTLTEHSTLAETADIAVGQYLDKAARAILPPELLLAPYGKALETFAFQNSGTCHTNSSLEPQSVGPQYDYNPPTTRQALLERRLTEWRWALTPPLVERAGGESKRMEYTFAGLLTYVERLVQRSAEVSAMGMEERTTLAREVQRIAFEHLASRLILYLTSPIAANWKGNTVVVSGGVAANGFLRHVLRSILDIRGFQHTRLAFPPLELATDNALMIAWAGIEMYDAGWTSGLDIGPLRKWSMDPAASDGGILGAPGWIRDGKIHHVEG
ncbi:Mitochondrial tRNAs modification protein [Elasticomyces elasticus]|nr:Mitochondrial tRNAs modification protein [Elasticomyces elasticus]